mmetsp:Transcript_62371/g.111127  ORF Transcript_62371/g.111127 Transcript_62371/m.111127 type:complete len:87 (-) Transcript_62371:63-323(-)
MSQKMACIGHLSPPPFFGCISASSAGSQQGCLLLTHATLGSPANELPCSTRGLTKSDPSPHLTGLADIMYYIRLLVATVDAHLSQL